MKKTNAVKVGDVTIGGGAPISVQSMTKTDTRDICSTISQIKHLHEMGCEIVRCAVPDLESAKALKNIVSKSPIPIVADIHFDYKLALVALDSGCHKLRLNPGNLKNAEKIKIVAREAKARNVPIRVGANSGSTTHGKNIAQDLVKAALTQVKILEDVDFMDIVVSVKTSNIETNIEANILLSQQTTHPIHIGLTEAGPFMQGIVKSTLSLVPLLNQNIGDTIRISLTDEPELEVEATWTLLELTGKRYFGPKIISCPTCGRTKADLRVALQQIRTKLKGVKNVTLAVMGCEVNGPGEAKDADCGIAFSQQDKCVVFEQGKQLGVFSVQDGIEKITQIAWRISG